jgi:hypothetical protein
MILIVKQEGESQRKSNSSQLSTIYTIRETIDKIRDVPPVDYLSCVIALVLYKKVLILSSLFSFQGSRGTRATELV